MNQATYIVYWTMSNGQPASAEHTEVQSALRHAELHRRQGMRFVTICAENADQVGTMGVDAVADGVLPDGQEYVYKTGRDRGRDPR